MEFKGQAGELDQFITLYSSTSTQDDLGQSIKTYTEEDSVWAAVDEETGTEAVNGLEQTESKPLTVTIRGGTGVLTSWKLRYESVDYRIISVRRIGREHWTEIKALRMGASESGD